MNPAGKSILSVAKSYLAMVNPSQKSTVTEGFKRPKWMPESIMDEMASDFVNAVKEAQEGGKDTFEFGGKKYKVTLGKAEEPKGEEPLPQGEDNGDDDKKEVKESLTGEQQIAAISAAYRAMYESTGDDEDESDKDEDKDNEDKSEKEVDEALKGDQHKLDVDGDGKIEGEDLAKLRGDVKSEALDPKADAGVWIKDFQQSDDPKFSGKDADKRKEMALAAWYAARREAGIKEEEDAASLKHDNISDKEKDQEPMEPAPDEVKESAESDHAALTTAAHAATAKAKGSKDHTLHAAARDAHVAAGAAHLEKSKSAEGDASGEHLEHAQTHLQAAMRHDFMHHRFKGVNESTLQEHDMTKKAVEGSKSESSEKFEPRAKGEKDFKDSHKVETSDYSDNTKENPTGADKVKAAELNKTGGKPSTETVGPDIDAETGEEKVSKNPENKTSGVGSSPTVKAEKEPTTGAEKVSQAPENKTK